MVFRLAAETRDTCCLLEQANVCSNHSSLSYRIENRLYTLDTMLEAEDITAANIAAMVLVGLLLAA